MNLISGKTMSVPGGILSIAEVCRISSQLSKAFYERNVDKKVKRLSSRKE